MHMSENNLHAFAGQEAHAHYAKFHFQKGISYFSFLVFFAWKKTEYATNNITINFKYENKPG